MLAISIPAGRLLSKFREDISLLRTSALLLAIVSAALVAFEGSNPSIAQRGILASNFPAAAEVQKTLLGIDKHLASIEGNTKQTVEKLTELRAAVKQETSVDPRKELANMGVKWEQESLHEALRNRDVRTMKLLLDGGMRPDFAPGTLVNLAIDQFSEEMGVLLLRFHLFDAPDECPVDDYRVSTLYRPILPDQKKLEFFRHACGNPAFQTKLDDAIAKHERQLNSTREYNANRTAYIANCVADLKARYTPAALFEEISRGGVLDRQFPNAASASLVRKIFFDVTLGQDDTSDVRVLNGHIEQACSESNQSRPEIDDKRVLDDLKGIRRTLFS